MRSHNFFLDAQELDSYNFHTNKFGKYSTYKLGDITMTNALAIFLIMLVANGLFADDYVAKPGDSVVVTVWEQQSLSGTVTVDSSGNITLPMPIGSFYVAGLTAKQISDIISEKLKDYLVNSTTYAYIIPAEGFIVHVLGEVQRQGFIRVPDGTTIQEAIGMMNGFTPLSDKKHITLIRKKDGNGVSQDNETTEQTLNLELFIEKNDRSANLSLKSGDVIIVPRLPESERIRYINVIGAVTKPGPFQTDKPMPLVDVLTQAGGLSSLAIPEEISVLSTSKDGNYEWTQVNFTSFLKSEDLNANPIIELGNTVFVPGEPIEKELKPFYVNVVGQVIKPGSYSVTEESRLLDAIYMAGGFVDQSAIDKVTIIHIDSDMPLEEKVDIKQYLISGDKSNNPLLKKGDTIFVPMLEGSKRIPSVHSAFFPTMRVSIIGEVAKPDIYQVSADVSVLDILKLAGGHTSQADLKKVILIRETKASDEQQKLNLKRVLTKGEFFLLPKLNDGDTIFIPQKPDKTYWGYIVKMASDISTIALAYLILTGKRY